MSGYPEMVDSFGPLLSYELAPRAKIFRRDQGTVVDMKSVQAIMRYNGMYWSLLCSLFVVVLAMVVLAVIYIGHLKNRNVM